MGLDPLLLCMLATTGVAGTFGSSTHTKSLLTNFFALILITLDGLTGMGYLVGPVVGSQMWRLTHRKTMSLIEDKEKLFHQHIKRNRVDPSTQSTTNPVPDFYGKQESLPMSTQVLTDLYFCR